MYFYNLSFHPFGATWGGRFKPSDVCKPIDLPCPPEGGPPTPEPSIIIPCVTPAPTPTETNGKPTDPPSSTPRPTPTKGGPKPTTGPTAVLPLAADLTTGAAPAAFFPLIVPLGAMALGRPFRPIRRRR